MSSRMSVSSMSISGLPTSSLTPRRRCVRAWGRWIWWRLAIRHWPGGKSIGGGRAGARAGSTAFAVGGRAAIIGMLLDVSERCQAERAVANQLTFIERLLDTIPSPVFFKDEVGR